MHPKIIVVHLIIFYIWEMAMCDFIISGHV